MKNGFSSLKESGSFRRRVRLVICLGNRLCCLSLVDMGLRFDFLDLFEGVDL